MVFNKALAEIIQKADMPRKMVMHDFYIAEVCLAVGGMLLYDPVSYIEYRQHSNNTVGVAHGFLNAFVDRLKKITQKRKVSVAEQAQDILALYGDQISKTNRKWLEQLAVYKHNFINKLKITCSIQTHYTSVNSSITNRLSLLLGNL